MIVRRSFHPVIPGKMKEAIAFLKDLNAPRPLRVYTSQIGEAFGTLCLEIEYESLADLETFSAEWNATPEAAAFWEKWYQFTKPGSGHAEIWSRHR